MLIFLLILLFISFSILDYFVIKFYIWYNKDLFYALHYNQIEREVSKFEDI